SMTTDVQKISFFSRFCKYVAQRECARSRRGRAKNARRPARIAVREPLFAPESRDERMVDQIAGGDFVFQSSRLGFLLDCRGNSGVEDSAVERERAAVLVVAGGGFSGVEADVFAQSLDAVVAVLARVPDAALKGAQKSRRLLFFLREPAFAGDETDVGPVGIEVLQIEELVHARRPGALGDREPENRRIDGAGGERGKARRRRADLQQG